MIRKTYSVGNTTVGKSARVDWLQAYQVEQWEGLVDGVPVRVERDGWSDISVRLAINLIGAPPMSQTEFAEYRKSQESETVVGLGPLFTMLSMSG
ncbi:MAG: hypothetical protein MUD03_00470 [Pirellula sp.]|jgi:hypothetical protein|nr:hypothetical protein [Pirellula sp.]